MERAGAFTAVPGWGGLFMGVTAMGAALIATQARSMDAWFAVWLVEMVVATVIGGWTMVRKARAVRRILSGPGRKFALGLCPAMFAGGALSLALYWDGHFALIPGTWLVLYGVA